MMFPESKRGTYMCHLLTPFVYHGWLPPQCLNCLPETEVGEGWRPQTQLSLRDSLLEY